MEPLHLSELSFLPFPEPFQLIRVPVAVLPLGQVPVALLLTCLRPHLHVNLLHRHRLYRVAFHPLLRQMVLPLPDNPPNPVLQSLFG